MKPLLLLFILCACLTSQAQKIPNDLLINYLLKEGADRSLKSPYLLLKLNNTDNIADLAKHKLSVIRHINDKFYIVLLPEHLKNRFENIFPVNNYWKLSPRLFNDLNNHLLSEDTYSSFSIVVTQLEQFKLAILRQKINVRIKQEYPSTHIVIISSTLKEVMQKIIFLESVTSIDLYDKIPMEEQAVNDFDLTTNKVNLIHSEVPGLNGNGLTFSVKENKPDTTDIDFKGRFLSTQNSSSTISTHATIMSTIIGGGGNTFHTGKGVAWGSLVSSSDFITLLPDKDSDYQENKITVQNHSYGTGIENFYGIDAMAYDMSSMYNSALLHVFSAGNSGTLSSSLGQYKEIKGFANLTGSFKMSKNILTVGSVDSFGVVPVLSSKGPAFDGRIKPDLVGYGNDGSSGAAAIVSGIALILQQAYKEKNGGNIPGSALIRSILLNSADDVHIKGPDFFSGYGNANAYRALNTVLQGTHFSDSVLHGNTKIFQLSIPKNAKNLKLTLAWNDIPATANAYTALINDLDMQLFHQASGQSWRPWVLNSFPHADSLVLLPTQKRDSLNNVEQITIDDPLPGDYIINITGYAVNGFQNFYVSYQWDTLHSFKWTYPTHDDNLFSNKNSILHWETTSTTPGILEYSVDGGASWVSFDSSVNLLRNDYTWNLPDTFSTGILRMDIQGKKFVSDTFTISRPVSTGVGFNCSDSVLLYWNKITNNSYILYKLADKYLEPVGVYSGKDAIISKSGNSSLFYTIAPVLSNGRTGVKSFTINYTTQGVGCYFKNFLADLQSNETSKLTIELGTTYLIKKIEIEKFQGNHYKTLQIIEPVNDLKYFITDSFLTKGLNVYRIKIVLSSNNNIYSDEEVVYNFSTNNFLVFPNPIRRGHILNVLSNNFDNSLFQLFTIDGRKLIEKKLNNALEQLNISKYSKGFYFFIITANGVETSKGKLIIQ